MAGEVLKVIIAVGGPLGDPRSGPGIADALHALALAAAALMETTGAAESADAALIMTEKLAEEIRWYLKELHAFRLETGCTLFDSD